MIITIDGPSGTGKTTVAKKVAERLHFSYFDTGALYRCVALLALQSGIDVHNEKEVQNLLQHFAFHIEGKTQEKSYFVNGQDVTLTIRSQAVNRVVSIIAAMRSVRSLLIGIQRNFAESGNVVFEGRDLGTEFSPDANRKFFLTARPEVRAQRRHDEMLLQNPSEVKGMGRDEMLEELKKRDVMDSTREIAPLKCPEDAFVIDTSALSLDEVVEEILKHV